MKVKVTGGLKVQPALKTALASIRWRAPRAEGPASEADVELRNGSEVLISFEAELSNAAVLATKLDAFREGFGKAPPKVQQEIYALSAHGHEIARAVPEIAFAFGMETGPFRGAGGHIHLDGIREAWPAFEWHEVGGDAKGVLPSEIVMVAGGRSSTKPVDQPLAELLQTALAKGYRPLYAWHHVARAERDHDPRGEIIDGITALELGIKEFLIESYPELEEYILKSPSPRIDVLYGKTLEGVVGEPSPWVRDIKKAAELRNEVVHRPVAPDVDMQAAHNFVAIARFALDHLEWYRLLRFTGATGAARNPLFKLMPLNLTEHWISTGYAKRGPPDPTDA